MRGESIAPEHSGRLHPAAGNRGNAGEKGEPRRLGPGQPPQQRHRDDRARPRDARHERGGLRAAEKDRLDDGERRGPPGARSAPIHPEHRRRAGGQRHRHHRGHAQAVDLPGKEQARGNHRGGCEQNQAPGARGVAGAAGEGAGGGRRELDDIAAKVHEHREQGAEMAGHVERDLGRPGVPAEQLANQDEMRGAGNREELGQSLHDPEPHGLGTGHGASRPAADMASGALRRGLSASGCCAVSASRPPRPAPPGFVSRTAAR